MEMERAAVELERRSRHLGSLIQQRKRRTGTNNRRREEKGAKGEEGKVEKAPAAEEVVVVVKEQKEAPAAKDAAARATPKGEGQRKGQGEVGGGGGGGADPAEHQRRVSVRVRAADMSPELQKRAFRCAQQVLDGMAKLDSKRLALTLKKEFDSSYGPAWHCIVGKSFGSFVTHSLGGFLYFSIDKVYILLFRTAVEPLEQ